MREEAQNPTRGRQQLKGDGKKKSCPMGQSGREDKKMRTGSGRYFSSSYKQDHSQKWKQKQKIAIHATPEPLRAAGSQPYWRRCFTPSGWGMCRRQPTDVSCSHPCFSVSHRTFYAKINEKCED